ncbi:hypothetical protein ACLB2K_004706 [Fragaria x ananassa]
MSDNVSQPLWLSATALNPSLVRPRLWQPCRITSMWVGCSLLGVEPLNPAWSLELSPLWDLQNRLQMRAHGDRYILLFTKAEDERYLLGGGLWFYGRSLFVMAEYEGLHDVASVPIDSFPVWVEMLGLPPRLMTNETAEKVGVTLGHVDQVDKLGIKRGIRSRVKIFHDLKDPVSEAFPSVPLEFGSAMFPVQLQFRYDWTVGFCRVCGLLEQGAVGTINPFAFPGSSSAVVIRTASLSFSLRGISAADLAAQLARFRVPMVIPSVPINIPMVAPATVVVETAVPAIAGVKRGPDMALETLGKRGRAEDSTSKEQMIIISPAKKRKIGRPKGSKNKKRVAEASNKAKLGPMKAKKRKFGARKT